MNLSQEAGNSTAELLFVNFNQDATYVGGTTHCTLDCRGKSNKQFVYYNHGVWYDAGWGDWAHVMTGVTICGCLNLAVAL